MMKTKMKLMLLVVAMAVIVGASMNPVSAATLTLDETVLVSFHKSEFNISVYPGKASYSGSWDAEGVTGSVTGVFGDGTVLGYRFFNSDGLVLSSYADDGTGIVAPVVSPPEADLDGTESWANVWTTTDPGVDFVTTADYTEDTLARGRNITGTIDISDLSSGTAYVIFGGIKETVTLTVTMSGAGQTDIQAVYSIDLPSSSSDPLAKNYFWVASFDFSDAGGYDTITYHYTISDLARRGRFVGVIIDNVAGPNTARNPNPADKAKDVCRSVVLGWSPGIYADKHDVYFGTNEADVNDATTTVDPNNVYKGRQNLDDDTYDPTIDLGGPLEWETTYYWRIDEVNAPPTDLTIFKGGIWQFTTEPCAYPITDVNATASSEVSGKEAVNTVNESGLTDDLHSTDTSAMWLSGSEPTGAVIQFAFDRVYKLHEMWVWNYNGEGLNTAYGCKDVAIEYSVNGNDWTPLAGVPQFDRAEGQPDYAHETDVDFGIAAKYVKLTATSNWGGDNQYGLSEVRFYYIPVRAREPSPADEATDMPFDLSWRPGREAAEHYVYFSTSFEDVNTGTIAPDIIDAADGCRASYGPLSLEYGKTYYWRVDEVNMAEAYTTWDGPVWSFTTTAAPQATNPNPTNGATGVDPNTDLSWTADPYAESHDVYFGTSSPPPFIHNQSDTTFDPPGTMDYGTTYYWRIDEVGLYGTIIGELWSFTVINYLSVDDMEGYTDRTAIITVWRDGYRGPDIVGDSGANVTVSTESDDRDPRLFGDGPPWPVRDSEAMQFAYDNDGSITIYVPTYEPYTYSADANYYSEAKAAIANLPIGATNWTVAGVKALTLWFYGDAGNAIEPMWVKLTDQGDISGKVTYGDYGEDPNDLKDPSWHEWNIALSDFGVDLTQVKDISIGFGDESNNTTPGGSGVVYFDDIRLYLTRCVLSKRSPDFARADFVEDCVVDYKELDVMTESWLVSDYNANGDGTLMNFPSDDSQWVTTGQINGALNFDGTDDYVNIDDYKGVLAVGGVQQPFTVANWFRSTGDGEMVSWGTDTGRQRLSWRIDGGTLRTEHGSGNLIGNTTVNDGEWHHGALVVNEGANLQVPNTLLYVDGQQDTTSSGGDDTYNLTAGVDVSIGRRATSNDRFFPGAIDDVRIYDYALLGTEVANIADETGGPVPLLWYKFDETSGDIAKESVGIVIYVPLPEPIVDLYWDGKVDFKDFAVLANSWLMEELWP